MKRETLDREELFAMVWERPATEVAHDLGISDVALGKLCRRLQVPKPPRGYWAMVKAGRIPKRPPLKACYEETKKYIARKRRKKNELGQQSLVKLSKLQHDFLKRSLQELANAGIKQIDCDLSYDGIRSIDPGLVAQILILIQNHYENWIIAEDCLAASRAGALQSIKGLVEKLLPLAKEQIVVFQQENRRSSFGDELAIIVRLSSPLQQRIAYLCRLVRENKLPYVASELGVENHAWSVRHLSTPGSFAEVRTLLCVSAQEVWLQCEFKRLWDSDKDQFETLHLPIQQFVSVELLPTEEIQLPAILPREKLHPYADRLKALKEMEQIYDTLVSTVYEMETEIPDERLALIDRLWFGEGESKPFLNARRAWRHLEGKLEDWEMVFEEEKAEFCRDVLAIEKGDIVIFQQQKSMVRVRIDSANVYVSESKVYFQIHGTRFRKDGTLGKRKESFNIRFENDLI